jgi:Putative MetA-pathway of phenol degradation
MPKPLLVAGLAVAVLFVVHPARAQFTDPRTYDNAPVDVNQLELVYAHAHSNTSLDTSLIVAGAQLQLNDGTVDYSRYLSIAHRLAWVEATVPIANLAGSINNTDLHADTTGTGDSSYQAAILLRGGPALTSPQFANFKPITTVGLSLTMTAPTGQYNSNQLLNLGSNLWSFKPEFALSIPFGPEQKWELDAYANASFYTHNAAYRGTQNLGQRPLPGFEAHLSYTFAPKLWASVDTRYSFGGTTSLNGVDQNNGQQNFTLGTELWFTPNAQSSIVFEFVTPVVHINGPTYTGFGIKYVYTWSKAHKS